MNISTLKTSNFPPPYLHVCLVFSFSLNCWLQICVDLACVRKTNLIMCEKMELAVPSYFKLFESNHPKFAETSETVSKELSIQWLLEAMLETWNFFQLVDDLASPNSSPNSSSPYNQNCDTLPSHDESSLCIHWTHQISLCLQWISMYYSSTFSTWFLMYFVSSCNIVLIYIFCCIFTWYK